MLHAADCAYDIERATEASITFLLQLIALTSGVIEEEDYLINLTTVSGTQIKLIHQSK